MMTQTWLFPATRLFRIAPTRLLQGMLWPVLVVVCLLKPAQAQSISGLELGRNGRFRPPSAMAGAQHFDTIRVSFTSEVFVDRYDLNLESLDSTACLVHAGGFSYDPAAFTATWPVSVTATNANNRYRVIISGVWTPNEAPVSGYTNDFHILTGDVSSDQVVSPEDVLPIINHLNAGLPYDPRFDVNVDGQVTPQDSGIIINLLNGAGGDLPLEPPGVYTRHLRIPEPEFRISNLFVVDGLAYLSFSGLPRRSRLNLEASGIIGAPSWSWIGSTLITSETEPIPVILLPGLDAERYRAFFE